MAVNAQNELKYLSNLMNTTTDPGTKNWAWNESTKYKNAAAPQVATTPAPVANNPYGDNSTLSRYLSLFNVKPVGLNTPQVAAPDPYVPDPTPTMMDWDTAYSQAKTKVDPQYNSLRQKAEVAYRDQREEIPQLLAARYGMSGLRGGRRASSEADLTQNESMGINELENQRAQATNSMATAIQDDDYSNLMDMWKAQQSLKAQQAADEYQRYRDTILDKQTSETNNKSLLMQLLGLSREDERNAVADDQWGKSFDLSKSNADREFDWTTNPDNWANKLKIQGMEADIQNTLRSANQPYKTSSGGGKASNSNSNADDAYRDDANGIINELTDASLTPAQQKAKAANLRTKIKAMVANGIMTQAEGAQREAVIDSIVKSSTNKKTPSAAISPYSFLNLGLGK